MRIKVVVHEAEEGGYWAEVPAIPGCATQGETMEELIHNLDEAIEGCLSVDVAEPKPGEKMARRAARLAAAAGKWQPLHLRQTGNSCAIVHSRARRSSSENRPVEALGETRRNL